MSTLTMTGVARIGLWARLRAWAEAWYQENIAHFPIP